MCAALRWCTLFQRTAGRQFEISIPDQAHCLRENPLAACPRFGANLAQFAAQISAFPLSDTLWHALERA
jgi:hypothetical protein